MKEIWKKAILILLPIGMLALMSACATDGKTDSVELSTAQRESLMRQVADSDVADSYSTYLRDEAFATAEVFGVDRDGDLGTAYVYLYEGEFVELKGKAYEMSGSAGEVILRFRFEGDDVTLTEVQWSADGGEHEPWLNRNFPAAYLQRAKSYAAHDENGKSILGEQLKKTVEEAMGVPVETDDLLFVDTEAGTYRIVRPITGADGSFDTETVETGNLSDL